jgi:hypothetical protein
MEGAQVDGRQQPVHNWLGAFRLPDERWAYFAVRDENFMPTGDFTGTREEVVERLTADYSLGGWNVVFGEEELGGIGFHNFQARNVVDFLPKRRGGDVRAHGWWALETLDNRRRTMIVAGSTMAVLGLAAGAAMLYGQYRRSEGARMMAAAMQATQRAASAATPAAPAPAPHPWPSQPTPADFAAGCIDRLRHLGPGGWQLESFECTPGLSTHAWKRAGSTIPALQATLPKAVIALDGESARLTEPSAAELVASDELLQPAAAVLPAVQAALQAVGASPAVSVQPAAPPPPGAPPTAAPQWQTFRFNAKLGAVLPTQVAPALEQPGVRLTKAAFNGHDWSIEGVIYAK